MFLVCQQDYTKSKELTDLSLSSEKTTSTFGVDLDKGKDLGIFLTFLFISVNLMMILMKKQSGAGL